MWGWYHASNLLLLRNSRFNDGSVNALFKTFGDLPNFYEAQHPIIKYKLALLRDKTTDRKLFKELTEEIALLLGYEATRDLPLGKRMIHTPLESFEGPDLENNQFVILPILRAGLGMSDGLLKLLPMASIGHIGF